MDLSETGIMMVLASVVVDIAGMLAYHVVMKDVSAMLIPGGVALMFLGIVVHGIGWAAWGIRDG